MPNPTRLQDRRYLGDGIYIAHDGYALYMTTETGVGITNKIIIEPAQHKAYMRYVRACIANPNYCGDLEK